MLAIFIRTIKDRKISLVSYALAGVLIMWMYVGIYPSIYEQAEKLNELLQAYPEEFLKAFDIKELSFNTLEKFVDVELTSIIWPIMALFLLLSIAGGAISREIEKGTIETLLSRPISRTKLFFEKYLYGVFALMVFIIFSVYSVVPLAELYNVEYNIKSYNNFAFLGLLFGLTAFSIGMMFSAIFSERSRVYMATGSIFLFMYIFNLVASLYEKFEDLKYISLFHYFDHYKAMIEYKIDSASIIIFVSVIVICTACGAIWFKKRDIAV